MKTLIKHSNILLNILSVILFLIYIFFIKSFIILQISYFLLLILILFAIVNSFKEKSSKFNDILILICSIILFLINKKVDSVLIIIMYLNVDFLIKYLVEKLKSSSYIKYDNLINEIDILEYKKVLIKKTKKICFIIAIVSILIYCAFIFIFKANICDATYKLISGLLILFPYSINFVPLIYYMSFKLCLKNNTYIKDIKVLKQISNCQSIYLTKTSVITNGNFKVLKLIPHYKKTDELLYYASSALSDSNHPIACAIKKYYGKKINIEVDEFIKYDGMGVEAIIGSDKILVGNEKLFDRENVAYPKVEFLATPILVALNNDYIGTIVLTDEINKDLFNIKSIFNRVGIKEVAIFSCNNKRLMKKISDKLKISKVFLDLDYIKKCEMIKNFDEHTMYVDDKIDLIKSSCIKVCTEHSKNCDVVLLNKNVLDIARTIKIINKMQMKIKQNLIFTFIIKLMLILLILFKVGSIFIYLLIDLISLIIMLLNSKYKLFKRGE